MFVVAERAGRGVRQRRVRQRPVVVVVRGVVVEVQRRRRRPLLGTCGESTVTREHEERSGGTGREWRVRAGRIPTRRRSFRSRHAQSLTIFTTPRLGNVVVESASAPQKSARPECK